MRHRVAHRKLGRVTEHRVALLRNQAQMLLRHERIHTTVPRAKELRPFVERLITVAKRGIAEGSQSGRALHARRLVRRDLADQVVASKLFDTIAPRFAARSGGYTRLLRVGYRRGDSAEVARVELVGSEYEVSPEAAKPEPAAPVEPKGVGGRLRAAARRIRGRKEPKAPDDTARGAAAKGERKAARGGSEKGSTAKRKSRKKSS